MKKLLKMSAFLAAMMLALAFVACSSDDDDGPSVVTTWTYEDGNAPMTLRFFDDDSFDVTMDGVPESVAKGTYDGDTTMDDTTIKMTVAYIYNGNKLQAIPSPEARDAKIANKRLTLESSDEIGLSGAFKKK